MIVGEGGVGEAGVVVDVMKCDCPAPVLGAVVGGLVKSVAMVEGDAAAWDGCGGHGCLAGNVGGNLQVVRFVGWSDVFNDWAEVGGIAVVEATVFNGSRIKRDPCGHDAVDVIGAEVEIVLMNGLGTADAWWFEKDLAEAHGNAFACADHGFNDIDQWFVGREVFEKRAVVDGVVEFAQDRTVSIVSIVGVLLAFEIPVALLLIHLFDLLSRPDFDVVERCVDDVVVKNIGNRDVANASVGVKVLGK